ncbi:rRNA maturation RNase YbeY [Citreimonas sp.]|uniref:rRNA maturation RNase YbeY n=1 Tax=Citreimonas sp. TaxID=3036715 RepID=UPI004059ED46
MLTETIIEDERWQQADLPSLAERAAQAALAHLGVDSRLFEIAVLGCDDARIAALNADFRGKPRPTNVLSWPETDLSPDSPGAPAHAPEPGTPDDPEHLGDVALAFETCAAEAETGGTPLGAHVTHLVVHGVLHLLGYDHEDDSDAETMERLEVEILGKLGLPDPYREREGQ